MIDVAGYNEVRRGETLGVDVQGAPVALVNVDGTIYAIHDTCTHARESLSGGWVEEDRIECPRHGAFFSVVTGEALTPPASQPLPTFAVEVRGGRVLVDPQPSHPHPLPEK